MQNNKTGGCLGIAIIAAVLLGIGFMCNHAAEQAKNLTHLLTIL